MAVMDLEKIEVKFPKKIIFSMKESKNNIAYEMLKYYALKMYELSKLSSSNCAKLLNISRIEFLQFAGKNKVSILDETEVPPRKNAKNLIKACSHKALWL